MRNLLLFFFIALSTQSFAQPKGFQQVKNLQEFEKALSRSGAAVQTISSDFRQTKNMALLSEKIVSRGKFYYRKEDKVRIEYTAPYAYLLVMNGGAVMVKDDQKTSRINTKNNKAIQSVNRIMIDCMRGTVLSNPDFSASVYENHTDYLLSLKPATEAMKKMFRSIDVVLSKRSFDVLRLSMTEQGGDYTDMDFSNAQRNLPLNDTLFKTR